MRQGGLEERERKNKTYKWERVMVLIIIIVDSPPRLGTHIILSTQVFHLLGQSSIITRSHHSTSHPWRAGRRERCTESLDTGEVGFFIIE
jgi:hypothetical protein